MFKAIVTNDETRLLHLSEVFIKKDNIAAALRCHFHVFQSQPDLQGYTFTQMHSRNHHLQQFGYFLRSTLCMDGFKLVTSERTQKLLGYRLCNPLSREAEILSSSDLNSLVDSTWKAKKRNGNLILSLAKLEGMAYELLSGHLKQIIKTHSNASKQARIFRSVCIKSTTGTCFDDQCFNLHLDLRDKKTAINNRFRIILHQILVISNMDFLLSRRRRMILRM
jgi:hypothetical protein